MSDVLEVEDGTTYTVAESDVQEWKRAEVDGTLSVDGTLRLVDDPEPPDVPVGTEPLDLPTEPLDMRSMNTGLATFLVGILGILGGLSFLLRNMWAMIALGFAIMTLMLSGLVGIGLEFFWLMIVGTVVLIMTGAIFQVSQ